MPQFVRVYTGPDGQSRLEHYDPPFEDFLDTEGAYGRGTPMQPTSGLTIRISPPDYFLDFHCAPAPAVHRDAGRPGRNRTERRLHPPRGTRRRAVGGRPHRGRPHDASGGRRRAGVSGHTAGGLGRVVKLFRHSCESRNPGIFITKSF